jgi:hypothetical protein
MATTALPQNPSFISSVTTSISNGFSSTGSLLCDAGSATCNFCGRTATVIADYTAYGFEQTLDGLKKAVEFAQFYFEQAVNFCAENREYVIVAVAIVAVAAITALVIRNGLCSSAAKSDEAKPDAAKATDAEPVVEATEPTATSTPSEVDQTGTDSN